MDEHNKHYPLAPHLRPPHNCPPPHGIFPPYFWNGGRGRYSQYWKQRFALLPHLPTSFDNANSIYELISWVQRFMKMLADDFQNLELEFEEFKDAITELIVELVPQLIREFIHSKEFHDRIFELIWEWWYEFQEDRIKAIEDKLKELEDRIEQLEDMVFDAEYEDLVEGRDYTIEMFNNYYTEDFPIRVGIINGYDRWLLRITCERLKNDNVAGMIQSHNRTLAVEPRSAIFGIKFIGNYSALGSALNPSSNKNNGSKIWNIYPKDIRATWEAHFDVVRYWDAQDYVFTFRSLTDGYNTQYHEVAEYTNLDDHKADYCLFQYDLVLLKPPTTTP